MNEYRANSVEVAKLFQARCKIEACGWSGQLLGSYAEANTERAAHLADHNAGKL